MTRNRSLIKVFRLLAICGLSIAFSSVAGAQTYTQVDYPGGCPGNTFLAGGPDPQGTSVGTYFDLATCSIGHGFMLTAKGVFTTFDPPGSIYTAPGFISPQGVVVGSYNDNSPANVSHGFILDGMKYTVVDARVRLAPLSLVSTLRVNYQDLPVPTLLAVILAPLPLAIVL